MCSSFYVFFFVVCSSLVPLSLWLCLCVTCCKIEQLNKNLYKNELYIYILKRLKRTVLCDTVLIANSWTFAIEYRSYSVNRVSHIFAIIFFFFLSRIEKVFAQLQLSANQSINLHAEKGKFFSQWSFSAFFFLFWFVR